jgi:hypothetical protein
MSGNMKKISIGLVTLLFCSLFAALLLNRTANASIEKQIDNSLASINETINKERTATSSNPYDYMKDNPDFENIVALGNDALPGLHKRLSNSQKSGLQEYILASAIERIAKVDLKKNESTMWESAKMFNTKWSEYVKTIPSLVETVTTDQALKDEEKVNKLIELGTPALPFILEKIELGDKHLFPAVIALTNHTKHVVKNKNVDSREWASQNKDNFSNLKEYVLSQK